jgi:5-methyltetrahydrofolate--homocysteine methyltransferase
MVLDTIEKISASFPKVNTICGLSNVSFGLPSRKLINQLFLVAAMTKGLTAVILDPLDKRIMGNLITTRHPRKTITAPGIGLARGASWNSG